MKTRWTSLFILSSLITLCCVSYAAILSSPVPALAAMATTTPPSTVAVQATASMSQTLSTEQIIFTMEYDDGGTDIFMTNAEDIISYEQILTNLTKTPDVAKTMPQWSADGQRIYFLVENQDLSTNLHTMRPDGTELTFLLEWPHSISITPFRGVIGTQLWGYNIATDNYFLEEITFSDRPIWTTDGSHLLYQFRPMDESLGYNWNVYPRSRQIIKVNATTGQKTVLASDPNYDYDFCEIKFNTNDNKGCEQWYGDWIQLRRFPFEPLTVPIRDSTEPYQPGDYEKEQCLIYGKECATYPDLFALNWRTGALLPWDEAPIGLPVPPTPTPSRTMKPDLNRPPVYSHPSGEYSFHGGKDNQSLWLVPQTGQPVLWVRDGENFIYVP